MIPLAELLGESPGIQAVRARVARLLAHGVQRRRLPAILIEGETGTGKGHLARVLHRAGPRGTGPLVEVNCAAIPETLLEAELFGFERGAFTDARWPKAGLFQTAHGGTLFLDEIGLLPERVQAKLLKALEDGVVRRLGSTHSEPADVAIVAAASESLLDAVSGRRFREDLYHRLAVVIVRLPPLAERGSDILLLADHFLRQACGEYGVRPKALTPDAQAALLAYRWPGNVRELANAMERTALLTETSVVTADDLELSAAPGRAGTAPQTPARMPPGRRARATTPEGREHVLEVLRETDWNLARTAARLKIPRSTLRYQMKKLGLKRSASLAESTRLAISPIGDAVQGPRAGPVRGVWRWERRQLAFLRATLMPSSDDAAPHVAVALQVLIDKTESFGGRIDQRGPLGIVAAFGLDPVEDAPRRAAHAAMAIRKATQHPRLVTVERVGVRIAIHASGGLVEQTAEARAIDLETACRAYAVLESLVRATEPDMILVSPDAARTLERRFALAPVALAQAPGGPAYRLEGLEQPGLAPRGAMTTFVGRESEMEHVHHVLARAAAGHGQVVAIVGEPGVGKSRFVWEVALALSGQGWLILRVSALSYGQATPYQPLIELIKGYFHIEDRDDPQQIREKVRGRLLALDPALAPSADALLALLDVPNEDSSWEALEPPQRRQRILDAIKGLCFQETRVQPLLLVLEDLHWADAETQALLDILVASLPTSRLCLLVDYRPEYQHTWAGKTYYSQLRLDPLPPERARELLRGLLGKDPGLDRLTALLIERTEGNPFFLEETVQTLVDFHILGGERGARHLTRPVEAIQVPATVEAVLAARIDQLPAEARRLLQVAAVIGKDVPIVLLRAVAQSSEDALRQGLATLQAAELLYEARLFPDVEYTFKHALTHDVAYGSLLQDGRRTLHGRIVATIERLYPDRLAEHVEELAHHAFRGDLWEKAVTYLRQAGVKAYARSANREAVAYLERALTALSHLPETRETQEQAIELRFDLRNSLHSMAEFGQIEEYLREAEALARTLDDQRRLGWVWAFMSGQHVGTGGPAADVRMFARRVEAIGETLGDVPLQVVAQYYLAIGCYSAGDCAETEQACRRLMRSLQGEQSRERFGLAMFPAALSGAYLARILAERGVFEEGGRHGQAAIQIAEALDHPYSLVVACLGLAYLAGVKGELTRAARLLERAVAQCRDSDITLLTPAAMASLGHVYALSGRTGESVLSLEQARTAYESAGIGYLHSLGVMQLGEAYLLAGHVEDARACADRALALTRERGEQGHEAWVLRLLGEIAAQADPQDLASAEEHYGRALARATELGMRPLVAHCHLGLGKLYRRAGDQAGAEARLTTACAMYREMGMTFWLEKAEAEPGSPPRNSP
jgi:DNA-binding NtrC family response regulator/tetratricopeptide (TPR) repeat protein